MDVIEGGRHQFLRGRKPPSAGSRLGLLRTDNASCCPESHPEPSTHRYSEGRFQPPVASASRGGGSFREPAFRGCRDAPSFFGNPRKSRASLGSRYLVNGTTRPASMTLSAFESHRVPPGSGTMRWRFRGTLSARCVDGKSGTMRCRSAPIHYNDERPFLERGRMRTALKEVCPKDR